MLEMLEQQYVFNSILAKGVYLFDVMVRINGESNYPILVGRAIYNEKLKKAVFQVIFPDEYEFDEEVERDNLEVEVELMGKILTE